MNVMKRIPTRFGPDTRFEIRPVPAASFGLAEKHRFEHLKNRLLLEWLEDAVDARRDSQVRRAANEAAALAWITPYPTLVFPVLFAEKAQAAETHRQSFEDDCRCSRRLLVV